MPHSIENRYLCQLREAIVSLLKDSLSTHQEKHLLTSAHALATNILRIKFSQSPSIKNHLGLNEHDLGYDCIAELFERDSKNQLIHFKTYFSNFDFNALLEKEILFHFRRLVSSAVNQNLMHVYRDFDPSLGKIIRNIKLSVTAHKAFLDIDRFDEACIAPIDITLNEHLQTIDQSALFDLLSSYVRGDEFVPELLSIYSRIIREQNDYSKIVPLLTVALVFRTLFIVKQRHAPITTEQSSNNFEVTEVIQKNILDVKTTILSHNHHGTTSSEIIEKYFQTIQNLFLSKINASDNSSDSLFKGLQQQIAHLDSIEYRKNHRTKIEYYYRLCREAIATELLERKNL
ncbi:MAG: hypothetical protein Q8L88_01450 [Bacteroidota bacterium]|nr:hypothetical protein [Bacteroidota bacterium]